jgi:hypothetical protein
LLQKAAKTYFGPGIDLSVGPNVLASQAVLTQFDKGVIAYMGDPSQLDAILQRIDDAAKATRK